MQIIVILNLGGNNMKQSEMPIGFAMSLAMNPTALKKFALLSEEQKQEIIAGTHSIKSKDEMHKYVDSIIDGSK